jgi:hypothetical protein
MEIDDRSLGFLLGLLVGEGHFGGDGRQPHITLRMHSKHERLFRWLEAAVPGSRLYGPYRHGERSYFQWMVRGSTLRTGLAPLIHRNADLLDDYTGERFRMMCERYRIELAADDPDPDPAANQQD